MMRRFLDLEDLENATIARLLEWAHDLEDSPRRDFLAQRVLGLIFLNPSVRTLASYQAGMSQLGGSSFVITPGKGSWGIEFESGVTMDGLAAEHAREAFPVLAQYADALAMRCFPAGHNLAEDLGDPIMTAAAEHTPSPLINLESARSHPSQALGDWKTLDDLGVPAKGGRFVLSWAYHPKALPLAVPMSTLKMALRRGMDVTLLRPDGFELPASAMQEAAGIAKESGASLAETDDRRAAVQGAQVIYAKSWQSTRHYGEEEAEQALRRKHRDWCVDEASFAGADEGARFLHCLPVRRNVVVADEVLDGPRSAVVVQAGNRLHVQKAVLLASMRPEIFQKSPRELNS